jgi:uncharacterized protein (DUF1810 family)
MSKGRLVKVRFKDQPPPNVSWLWIPVGNCHACRYYVKSGCANENIPDADFLYKYVYGTDCPGFEAGADDPDRVDLLDVMKAAGVVSGTPGQQVEVIVNERWSIALAVRAHHEQTIFIHMATAADSGHPDYVDMSDDLEEQWRRRELNQTPPALLAIDAEGHRHKGKGDGGGSSGSTDGNDKPPKPRLPLPQVRVLRALLPVSGEPSPLSRTELAQRMNVRRTSGTISVALEGRSDSPHKGLLDAGLVTKVKGEGNEAEYQITTEGMRAIEDYLKKRGVLPPPRDPTLSTNIRYQKMADANNTNAQPMPASSARPPAPTSGGAQGGLPPTIDHKTVSGFSNSQSSLPTDFTVNKTPGRLGFLFYDHKPSGYKVVASWKYGTAPAADQSALYTITVLDGAGQVVSTYKSQAARDEFYVTGRATQVANWLHSQLPQIATQKSKNTIAVPPAPATPATPSLAIVDDPHDLNRFVQAQADVYDRALVEVRSGKKRSHWMWFIFPQLDRLPPNPSPNYKLYAIKSIAEAKSYLSHPVLGPRLLECAEAALSVQGRTAHEIFGSPDDKKLRSCATLFASVSQAGSAFHRLLDKYYQGERDSKTLRLLGIASDVKQDAPSARQ